MKRLKEYFTRPRPTPTAKTDPLVAPELEAAERVVALEQTGPELIARVQAAIELGSAVLLIGPRGSGKTYSAEQAIRATREAGIIGGWRFLQGNREIPRDTLSEDALVVADVDAGEAQLSRVRALALRGAPEVPASLRSAFDDWRADEQTEALRAEFPEWPAIPGHRVTERDDPRRHWRAQDRWVLFLDEITRFGEGFLDSLLSVVEHGRVVRRGEEFYVPVTVIATANPPGYDPTAKKLSPPLEARFQLQHRISQPDLRTLIEVVLPRTCAAARLPMAIPFEVQLQAAAAILALWGEPHEDSKGSFFLTSETRAHLQRLMAKDKALADAMRSLGTLVSFGPDARGAIDWIMAAAAHAGVNGQATVAARDLESQAVAVLAHKVRDAFGSGTDPKLSAEKENVMRVVVGRVLRLPIDVLLEVFEAERPQSRLHAVDSAA